MCILLPISDQVAECNSLRVPKIRSIFGVVGMLKLLAGEISEILSNNLSICECFHLHLNQELNFLI